MQDPVRNKILILSLAAPLAGVTAHAAQETPAPATPALPPAMPAPSTLSTPSTPSTRPDTTVPAMTLDEAIAYARRNNPRVAGAAAEVRQAQARITQRRAERGPQLGVNNFVFRQGPVIPGFQPGAPPSFPPYRYNVGVSVSQMVFDWGQRSRAQAAAEAQTQAAGFRQGETENDVALVVGVTFYNVFRGQELVNVANERVRSATEQLRVARARFEADVAPRFDVIRAEAELANAQQDLIAAQNDRELAEAALNTALGREVTTPVNLRPEPRDLPEDLSYERLRELALQQRPQLRALEATIRGDEQTIRSRRAENRPQVGLSGAYDRPNPGGFAPQTYRYNGGLVMTFPFFDSGFTRGRVREAEATRDTNRQALQNARQQMELDIRQAQLDLIEARKRTEAARTEQASAREALRVAEVRYRAGVGTTVEVTDAQLAVARAGQNLANAQFDYLTAIVRLEYAVGAEPGGAPLDGRAASLVTPKVAVNPPAEGAGTGMRGVSTK